MNVKILINGITTKDSLFVCLKHQVEFLGVVFYSLSPRNVSFDHASEFSKLIGDNIKKVAVVVNPDNKLIKQIQNSYGPHYFQMDDNQTPSQLELLKQHHQIKLIKTIYVDKTIDLNLIKEFEPIVDGFIFDAAANARLHVDQAENTFDWGILKKLNLSKFWILSGGLNKFNVCEAIRMSGAKIISASSTLEGSPGIKDVDTVNEFLRLIKTS